MRPAFSSLVSETATVSDNIRALNRAGYSRAEIATLLGKRYQHVRNVLVADEQRAQTQPGPGRAMAGLAENSHGYEPPPVRAGDLFIWVDVAPDGSLNLPDHVRAALEVPQGGKVLMQIAGDMSVSLLSLPAAIRQAQAMVKPYLRPGVSVVDELLADRRAEAVRENEG